MSKKSDIKARIGADIEPLIKDLKRAEFMVRQQAQKLQEIGQNLSMRVTLPLVGVGVAAVKTAADFERYSKGMEAIMGDAKEATAELRRLRDVAQNPGLSFEQAVKGSTRLQAVGFSAAEARKTLAAFGNALALVGGTAQDLDGVNLALSQIMSKGKVSAEEINQIAERVPQIRKAMQDAFGTADTEAIQKMGISSKQFIAGIVTEMEKLAKAPDTLSNSFNNMQQSIWFALTSLGNTLNETFNIQDNVREMTSWIDNVVDSFNSMTDGAKRTIFTIAGIAAAIGPVIFAVGQLKMMWAGVIGSVLQMIKFLNPTTLIIAGIAAAVYIIVRNWDKVKAAIVYVHNAVADLYNSNLMVRIMVEAIQTAFQGVWVVVKGLGSFIGNIGSTLLGIVKGIINLDPSTIADAVKNGLEQSVQITKNTALELGKTLVQGVQDTFSKERMEYIKEEDVQAGVDNIKGMIYGSIFGEVKDGMKDGIVEGATQGFEDLSKIPVEKMTEAQKKKFIKSRQSDTANIKDIDYSAKTTGEGTGLEKMQQMFGEGLGTAMFQDAQEAMNKFVDKVKKDMPAVAEAVREPFQAIPKVFEKIASTIEEKIKPVVEKIAEVYNSVIGSITATFDAFFAYKEGKLEQDKEKELANLELRNMSEEQSAAARAAIEEKYEKKRKEIAKKQAIANKALAIMQITVDTAVASIKAFSQLGPIGGPIAAGAIAALGAAQIGLVAATPIPALAEGGLAFGDTLARVGDNFNARVDPEVIAPLSDLRKMLKPDMMGGQQVQRVEIEGDKLVMFLEHMNRKMVAQRGYGLNFG